MRTHSGMKYHWIDRSALHFSRCTSSSSFLLLLFLPRRIHHFQNFPHSPLLCCFLTFSCFLCTSLTLKSMSKRRECEGEIGEKCEKVRKQRIEVKRKGEQSANSPMAEHDGSDGPARHKYVQVGTSATKANSTPMIEKQAHKSCLGVKTLGFSAESKPQPKYC